MVKYCTRSGIWPAKQWPVEHYASLSKWWISKGGKVAVLGAPGEEAVGAQLNLYLAPVVNLIGKTSIPELMHILSESKFCVVNDSGAMHLAASVRAKVLLFLARQTPSPQVL